MKTFTIFMLKLINIDVKFQNKYENRVFTAIRFDKNNILLALKLMNFNHLNLFADFLCK